MTDHTKALADALEELMEWQVKHVKRWHNSAYDNASRALAAYRAALTQPQLLAAPAAQQAAHPAPAEGDALKVIDELICQHYRKHKDDSYSALLEFANAVLASKVQPKGTDEPVAWMDDGTKVHNGPGHPVFRVITADTKQNMPASIQAEYTTPLYAHQAPSPAPAHACNCPNIGACDGSCAPYVVKRDDPQDLMLAEAWEMAKRLEPAAAEMMRKLCKRLREDDRMLSQTIDEREERQQFIDDLLDAIHGPDRHEWTSAYGFNDAMEDALERLAALEAASQAPAVAQAELAADQPGPRTLAVEKTCKGCPQLKTERWHEYLENDETDHGTSATCGLNNTHIATYWHEGDPPPDWCPAVSKPSVQGTGGSNG